jgi:hypothetical protein
MSASWNWLTLRSVTSLPEDKWLTWTFVPATVTRMSAAAIAV